MNEERGTDVARLAQAGKSCFEHLRYTRLHSRMFADKSSLGFRPIPFRGEPLTSLTNAAGFEPPIMNVFFAGDFKGAVDTTPIGDRRPIRLGESGVPGALGEDYNRQRIGVTATTLPDFDACSEITRSLWHAADWFARTCPLAGLELVNITADDLDAERVDAPTFGHSWVRSLFSDTNHIAMDPRHLIALGFEIDPSRDSALLEHLGMLAQRYAVPVIVPTSMRADDEETPNIAKLRAAPWARWLTFVAGDFRTDTDVAASSVLLLARQIARRFGEGGVGPGLWGGLDEPSATAFEPGHAARAWSRGVLAPAHGATGAEILHDATFTSAPGTARSLSWLLLAQRFTHEARLLHFQHFGYEIPGGTGAAETAAFLEERLRARYPRLDGLSFSLERARWAVPPENDRHLFYEGTLDLDLRLVARSVSGGRIEHVEPLSWRFTC